MSRTQAQAPRISVRREVRSVDGDVCKLSVYKGLEEMRRRRLLHRIQPAGSEIAWGLPVGGEVSQERRLEQGAAATVLAIPPNDVVRNADLDAYKIGPG